MWKFSVILVLTILSGLARAEEENQTKNGPVEPTLYEIALCYAADSPYTCVKDQLGRALDSWESQVEEKRHDLLVQADEEAKESAKARGLTEDEKTERPSDVITVVDRGLSAIGQEFVSMKTGRDGRAMRQHDDTNDFNDDFTLLDGLSRVEAEGNVDDSRDEKEAKGLSRQDLFYGGGGGKRGKGKKGKKGKRGMMKIFFIGALIKAKIEMLLKILSFHLQLKFFAIALASFIINLARFWVDLKKAPAKVVYHEHATHQHHYDEHDDWGNSNWKRQANGGGNQEYSTDFAHRLAYSSGYNPNPAYNQQPYHH